MRKSKVDRILSRLSRFVPNPPNPTESPLSNDDLIWLCMALTRVVRNEPILLRLKPPISVCGDVHGQFTDVLRVFSIGGPPATTSYLFLGDYVGRGSNSIETMAYLFALKVKYAENVFLLRGNHETDEI